MLIFSPTNKISFMRGCSIISLHISLSQFSPLVGNLSNIFKNSGEYPYSEEFNILG